MTTQIFKPFYLSSAPVWPSILGNFHAFLSSEFSQNNLFLFLEKKMLSKIKSNSSDHDQAR